MASVASQGVLTRSRSADFGFRAFVFVCASIPEVVRQVTVGATAVVTSDRVFAVLRATLFVFALVQVDARGPGRIGRVTAGTHALVAAVNVHALAYRRTKMRLLETFVDIDALVP